MALRTTQRTGVNETSSRSHAIIHLAIGGARGGELTLVDCAGSEWSADSDKHCAKRRKEVPPYVPSHVVHCTRCPSPLTVTTLNLDDVVGGGDQLVPARAEAVRANVRGASTQWWKGPHPISRLFAHAVAVPIIRGQELRAFHGRLCFPGRKRLRAFHEYDAHNHGAQRNAGKGMHTNNAAGLLRVPCPPFTLCPSRTSTPVRWQVPRVKEGSSAGENAPLQRVPTKRPGAWEINWAKLEAP